MPNGWKIEELAASIDAYRKMQRFEADGKPYSKRKLYQDLAQRLGRKEKSIEYRMQNISAVLAEMGEQWLSGLKPATNVGVNVRRQIIDLLTKPKAASLPVSNKLLVHEPKLPAMRDWLIEVARSKGKVTYSETMAVFGIGRATIGRALGRLGNDAKDRGEPIITALVVSKTTQHCSKGLAAEFGIHDDDEERQRLYKYWANKKDHEDGIRPLSSDLEVRAAKFVSVEARPDQAVFRRLVFLKCRGRCVISGCDIEDVLDAAHKKGRDWRQGHNLRGDGFLLRKDLHALYDRGLLSINRDGVVELNGEIAENEHYRQFAGKKVSDRA